MLLKNFCLWRLNNNMSNSYFVIVKKINGEWEDWVIFKEEHTLDQAIETFITSENYDKNGTYKIIKRTDKTIPDTIIGKS